MRLLTETEIVEAVYKGQSERQTQMATCSQPTSETSKWKMPKIRNLE
ncbi:MAG: hypothetical protein K6F22_03655 [Prevotella sp.]|nr:hypothetical protein [Prevotella sp.]